THNPDNHLSMPAPIYNPHDWVSPTTYDPKQAYTNSKLAIILHSKHLAAILDPTQIHVTIYDPGYVPETDIMRNLGYLRPLIAILFSASLSFNAWWWGVRDFNSRLGRSCGFLKGICLGEVDGGRSGEYFVIDWRDTPGKEALDVGRQEEFGRFLDVFVAEKGFA
ncbi:hypothetical protein HDU67_004348, partial [Dinochytrium kinnereticum]